MIRYLIAIGRLGLACLAYAILAFGTRFDRADELTGDGQPEGAIPERVEGQTIHDGAASTAKAE